MLWCKQSFTHTYSVIKLIKNCEQTTLFNTGKFALSCGRPKVTLERFCLTPKQRKANHKLYLANSKPFGISLARLKKIVLNWRGTIAFVHRHIEMVKHISSFVKCEIFAIYGVDSAKRFDCKSI